MAANDVPLRDTLLVNPALMRRVTQNQDNGESRGGQNQIKEKPAGHSCMCASCMWASLEVLGLQTITLTFGACVSRQLRVHGLWESCQMMCTEASPIETRTQMTSEKHGRFRDTKEGYQLSVRRFQRLKLHPRKLSKDLLPLLRPTGN